MPEALDSEIASLVKKRHALWPVRLVIAEVCLVDINGRKVKGTIHWVSAKHAIPFEARIYDRLFTVEEPGAGDVDYLTQLNSDSLKVVQAFMEPALNDVKVGETVQFERQGYFCKDKDSSAEKTVFNRTVALKDSWAKKAK